MGGIRPLRPLATRLRQQWLQHPIALRADSDFCKPALLGYAEYTGCRYAIGMARNPKLEAPTAQLRRRAERRRKRDPPVRLFTDFIYKAQSWSGARRIAVKREYTALTANLRLVVTNRFGTAEEIFTWDYQRGKAENFIKEFKGAIPADRLSCSTCHANPFLLQLHAVAYNLVILFRRRLLQATERARATIEQLRVRLFKLGARVRRSCRRLWFRLPSAWPGRPLFERVLCPQPQLLICDEIGCAPRGADMPRGVRAPPATDAAVVRS